MTEPLFRKEVLDHGFVELLDIMPHDIPEGAESRDIVIVNAARTSYLGESKGTKQDKKLLRYLYKNHHSTPFEQVELQFRIKAPILVWWQWVRHRTWNYNLQSGRYTEYTDEFYIPKEWRLQDTKNKQGSTRESIEEVTTFKDDEITFSAKISDLYNNIVEKSFHNYEVLVANGVAREQARLFLPAFSLYHEGYAKVDLKNLLDFIRLRNDEHAQWEIRQYAAILEEIVKEYLPWTYEVFNENRM